MRLSLRLIPTAARLPATTRFLADYTPCVFIANMQMSRYFTCTNGLTTRIRSYAASLKSINGLNAHSVTLQA